ncbi:MAG: hypothetical protein HY825_04300 [Acidobacteria bacterium]|nr:hypothetical protein [Acidobacteriota bacterium]
MRREVVGALLGAALLALAAVAASADELTVNSILAARDAGAPVEGLVAMVNSPANTVAMTAADLVTLRHAGVPEAVIGAIWARLPAPTPGPVPLQPDDARLTGIVSLIRSGMSGSIIAEQVRQSGEAYNLTVNDLLYLKQNGASETTMAALMATSGSAPTAPAVAPSELAFDDLVMVRGKVVGFLKKNRHGRLVMDGETFRWVDKRSSSHNLDFQIAGVEKVWLTCDARSSGNFCHQINFKIVKGDRYSFQDANRDSGSNAAVTRVMEALRTYYPRLTYSTPNVDD